jgi:hypothetical protein
MAVTIKVKRGAEAGLPTLASGEFAWTTDTYKLFMGTGTANKQVTMKDDVTSMPTHALVGAQHSASGLTVGYTIRATGTTTFAWAQLQHDDLGGVTSSQHHTRYSDTEAIGAIEAEPTLNLQNVTIVKEGTATSTVQYTSHALTFQGSGWDTSLAQEAVLEPYFKLVPGSGATGSIPYSLVLYDDSGASTIVVDMLNKRLGVGLSPSYNLDISGDARISSNLTVQGTLEVPGYYIRFASGDYIRWDETNNKYLFYIGNSVMLSILSTSELGDCIIDGGTF